MPQRRIFVSATTRGLESYRRLAIESLRKRGYEVDDQAVFNLTFLEINEKVRQRIEACDAVVCLIGFAYGGEPSECPADQLRAELAELRFPWEAPPPVAKPCNLPLASIGSLFKGREGFLADLQQRLGVPGARAMAIVNRLAVHGLGGVGKTRATLEYAWRRAEDYTALLFVSAPSVVELRANLANLVGVLGTTARETSVDEQLAEVLRWLEVHPGWLLIVDNVDTEEAAGEVQRLLARLRAGHVLITSRIGNWSAGVEPLELDVLAPADATGKRPPTRRYFDPSGLTGITRIMGVLNSGWMS
jgi:Domain of unknown function (DUF4062)